MLLQVIYYQYENGLSPTYSCAKYFVPMKNIRSTKFCVGFACKPLRKPKSCLNPFHALPHKTFGPLDRNCRAPKKGKEKTNTKKKKWRGRRKVSFLKFLSTWQNCSPGQRSKKKTTLKIKLIANRELEILSPSPAHWMVYLVQVY